MAVRKMANAEMAKGTATRGSAKSGANRALMLFAAIPPYVILNRGFHANGVFTASGSGNVGGCDADRVRSGRLQSAEKEGLLRRRFTSGYDPVGTVGRAEAENELLDGTPAILPVAQVNGTRSGCHGQI